MIIDAHIHLFEHVAGIMNSQPLTSLKHGKAKVGNCAMQLLPPSFEQSASTVETAIAHMDMIGVDKAVIVQNGYYGYHNEYAQKACSMFPDRFKAMAIVNVLNGTQAASELVNLTSSSQGMSGLKIEALSAFDTCPEETLGSPCLNEVWTCCHELKLIVMVHIRPKDIHALCKIARDHTGITFCICHLGYPSGDPRGTGWTALLELVKEQKMYMDMSSMPVAFTGDDYPYMRSQGLIETAYKHLGPEKILWGSDYPGILTRCTYHQTLTLFTNYCNGIPDVHKDIILGTNALHLFW